MSQAHKDALAEGRRESAIVRRYLEQLGASGRGSAGLSASEIERRLAEVKQRLVQEERALNRIQLIQQRHDLEDALRGADDQQDEGDLEERFVSVARQYSARKGIGYSAWREMGVDAAILKKAGIARTRRG
jgi:hypothetical protein